jgi:hypothetical protein
MKKKLITMSIVLLLAWPALANDDEIVEFLDFFENMELVEDENFKELVDDKKSELDEDNEDEIEDEENA